MTTERHHHHATVDEVVVFHGDDGEPDYLFTAWEQSDDEPCECGLVDPFSSDGEPPRCATEGCGHLTTQHRYMDDRCLVGGCDCAEWTHPDDINTEAVNQ